MEKSDTKTSNPLVTILEAMNSTSSAAAPAFTSSESADLIKKIVDCRNRIPWIKNETGKKEILPEYDPLDKALGQLITACGLSDTEERENYVDRYLKRIAEQKEKKKIPKHLEPEIDAILNHRISQSKDNKFKLVIT